MNKLESELQRLYFLPGQTWVNVKSDTRNPLIKLITANGLLRCFVISVKKGCDWTQVNALYQGVQEDLDLPAPAISVCAEEGYQVWFSLAEPIALQAAQEFMKNLSHKYLAEIKVTKLKFRPGTVEQLTGIPVVPVKQINTERWSAYIDPSMGSMFIEETWLEMPPGLDKQASMLAGLKSMKAQDFERASSLLKSHPEKAAGSSVPQQPVTNHSGSLEQCRNEAGLNMAGNFSEPKSFLLAVMNEPSASAEQRIQAAIALLPFFEKDTRK